MSWFRGPSNGITRFVHEATEPILRIARKITPKTGMLDLSPIVAVIGLDLLRYLIFELFTYL